MGFQAASDSEQESNEDAGTSRKPQKRARVKTQPNVSKTSEVASPTLAATHGCLTLLKKKRSGGVLSFYPSHNKEG